MNAVDLLDKVWSEGEPLSAATVKSIARFLQCSIQADLNETEKPKAWIESLRNAGGRPLAEKAKKDNANPDLVNRTIDYIEQNYAGELTIVGIAEALHVTPNHLSSLFHKRMGVTFMQYLTRLRMLKAKELLADPSTQVQQAAEQVGYFSSRHFTKLFKEFFDCYPSEYKRNLKP